MKAMTLKFNMFVKNVDVINDNANKNILNIILWSTALLAVSYLIFLGIMVTNIVERKGLEARARVLSSEVGEMELSYLSMSNNVDVALSRQMGFEETKAVFVTRKSLGLKSSDFKIAKNDL